MPDFNELTFADLEKEYKKTEGLDLFQTQQNAGKAAVKDIFGDQELLNRYFSNMGAMSGRDIDFAMAVIAKRNILRRKNVKAPLKQLIDFRSDSRELKDNIREEMQHYAAMDITEFNNKILMPGAKEIAEELKPVFIESQQKSEEESMRALEPYFALLNGLYDAHVQKMRSRRGNTDLEDAVVTDDMLGYMFEYLNSEDKSRNRIHKITEVDHHLNTAENYVNGLVIAALHNSARGLLVHAMQYEQPGKVLQIVNNISDIESSFFNMKDRNGRIGYIADMNRRGLLSRLSDNERAALCMDPALQRRLTVRQGRVKGTWDLYFDNIDLQMKSLNPGTGSLEELKHSIGLSWREHTMQSKAGIEDFTYDSMRKNAENIREAAALLTACTKTFRSSDEYRNMQTAVQELSEAADTLAERSRHLPDEEPGVEEVRSNFLQHLESTRKTVEAYLKKKGAFTDKTQFKNSYEADRVAAARALLRTIRAKKEAFDYTAKIAPYEEKYDRFVRFLSKQKGVAPELVARLSGKKKIYCSPERIALHEKAKAALAALAEKEDILENKVDIKPAFRPLISAVLSSDKNKYEEKLAVLSKNGDGRDDEFNYHIQKAMIEGFNRAGVPDLEKLRISGKRNNDDVVRYELENIRALKCGSAVRQAYGGAAGIMRMTVKEEGKKEFSDYCRYADEAGRLGMYHLALMANDDAFILPLDDLIQDPSFGKTSDDIMPVIRAAQNDTYPAINGNNRTFSESEVGAIVKTLEMVRIQAGLKNKIADAPQKKHYSAADFDGAVIREDRKAKAAPGQAHKAQEPEKVITHNEYDELDENLNIKDDPADKPAAFKQDVKYDVQAPEALIHHEAKRSGLADLYADELAKEIADARARLEKNYEKNNIYPEAADDMKIILFAEHLKREFMNRDDISSKQTASRIRPAIADGKTSDTYTYARILNENTIKTDPKMGKAVSTPCVVFREECRKFSFGRIFADICGKAQSEDPKDNEEFLKQMHLFAKKDGAKEVYKKILAIRGHRENKEVRKPVQNAQLREQEPVVQPH